MKKREYFKDFFRVFSIIFSFLLFASGINATAAVDVESLFNIKVPSAIAWSPDGDSVAYQVTGPKGSDIFLYSLQTRKSEKLVSGIPSYEYLNVTTYQKKEPDLIWSSDGSRIIYTTGKEYYAVPKQGGEPELYASSQLLGMLMQLSPDQKKISFIRDGDLWIKPVDKEICSRLTAGQGFLTTDYQRFGRLFQWPQWSPDGKWIAFLSPVTESSFKIGLVSTDGGEAIWLVPDEHIWSYLVLNWSPDSLKLAVSCLSADFKRKELMVYDISNKRGIEIWKDEDDKWVSHNIDPSFQVNWSTDSHSLAFLSNRDGWKHLYVAKADGSGGQQLTQGEFEVYQCWWSPDGNKLYYVSNKGNPHQRLLWGIPSEGGQSVQMIQGQGVCIDGSSKGPWASPRLSPDGGNFAYTFTSADEPPSLQLISVFGPDNSIKIFDSLPPDIAGVYKASMKAVEFPSSDGMRIPAVLMTDVDLEKDKKQPALIYMYGGWGQNALFGWALDFKSLLFHYLAQKGYVILLVDPRGSEGYGNQLAKGLYREGGGKQIDDLVAGAKYLVSLGFIDPKGIGIFGHSYGSYLAVQTMVKAPEVFAAGIAQAGVYDWPALGGYGTYMQIRLGSPDEIPNMQIERSPLTHIDRLQGALLVVHGSADYNAPMSESDKLVKALIKARKNFDYMVYPGEFHSWEDLDTGLDFILRVTKFLDSHLRQNH